MLLSSKSIRRLIKELDPPLVTRWDPRRGLDDYLPVIQIRLKAHQAELETRFIEGSALDLSLRTIETQNSDEIPFLGKDERRIPASEPCPTLRNIQNTGYTDVCRLHPGRSYKLQSYEYINMPPWLCGILHNRTSVFRSNADQSCTFIKPGFSGRITTEVHVVQGQVDVQRGFPFVSLAFATFITDEDLKRLQEERRCSIHDANEFREYLEQLRDPKMFDKTRLLRGPQSHCDIIASETDPYGSRHDWGSKITTDGETIGS